MSSLNRRMYTCIDLHVCTCAWVNQQIKNTAVEMLVFSHYHSTKVAMRLLFNLYWWLCKSTTFFAGVWRDLFLMLHRPLLISECCVLIILSLYPSQYHFSPYPFLGKILSAVNLNCPCLCKKWSEMFSRMFSSSKQATLLFSGKSKDKLPAFYFLFSTNLAD